MSYKVYFVDGYEITGVETVEFGHDRDVKVHYGLGQGSFPIPSDKELKTWDVKCQQDTNAGLFDVLEKMLDNQKESRLIISSDVENISEMVLLCGYSKAEQDMGVYDVTVKFIEYKEVSMKTTDIPYIARPGKIPTPPKTVVMDGKNNTPNKLNAKFAKSAFQAMSGKKAELLYRDEFGKAISNPCLIKPGDEIYISDFELDKMTDADKEVVREQLREIDQIEKDTIAKKAAKQRQKAEDAMRKAKDDAKKATEKAKKINNIYG